MTKTLKYKLLKNNNITRKIRGGIGINIFGKSDISKADYGKPRVFIKPKNRDLPFMYFYDIQVSKTEKEKEISTTTS
jgi:hypothetical protein